jgi:hypothetical protein
MDEENGDNQGFGLVWGAGAAIVVILMVLGLAVLFGWVRVPFLM